MAEFESNGMLDKDAIKELMALLKTKSTSELATVLDEKYTAINYLSNSKYPATAPMRVLLRVIRDVPEVREYFRRGIVTVDAGRKPQKRRKKIVFQGSGGQE